MTFAYIEGVIKIRLLLARVENSDRGLLTEGRAVRPIMDNYLEFDPEQTYVIDIRNGIRLICCDCGLTHVLRFEPIGDEGLCAFTIEVDEEETERVRKGDPSLLEQHITGNGRQRRRNAPPYMGGDPTAPGIQDP